jgi:carotenoid cleavage dioxygenase-like enzyme
MGNKSSKVHIYQSKLPQEPAFSEYCHTLPNKSNISLTFNDTQKCYVWNDDKETKAIQSSDSDVLSFECQESLLISAGAYTGHVIDHLLDGYSWGIFVRVLSTPHDNKLEINLQSYPIIGDQILYNQELAGSYLQPGLFTSDMPWWRKLMLGNLFKFITGGLALGRETGHQPIYYPPHRSIIFCSTIKYNAFEYNDTTQTQRPIEEGHQGRSSSSPIAPPPIITENGAQPSFPPKKYMCMHPHYDQTTKRMLTYTFTHEVLRRRTHLTFYEFSGKKSVQLTDYTINDRAALHMFGFTKHYYVLFANSFQLEKCGQIKLLFGKALLRALNDTFISNLIIHFVPRPEYKHSRSAFAIDTNRPGFVYHSINCFESSEDGNGVVVDAFVSQLNSARESAQFELDPNREVFDNNGDPYRFIINVPSETLSPSETCPSVGGEISIDPCKSKLIASVVDSTIDFHCINSDRNGLRHHYTWIVGHERKRNIKGEVKSVVSSLYKVYLPSCNICYDPKTTVTHCIKSDEWVTPGDSCYLRTPMFVPRKGSSDEDDGYLFMWSYEFGENETKSTSTSASTSNKRSKLIILSAKDLSILLIVPIPSEYHIPYSVHSWIYPYIESDKE